jgi:hypothetical protein
MNFEDFKKSFSYGERSDLNFKFLAQLSDTDAQNFIEDFFNAFELLIDKNQPKALIDVFIKGQRSAYNKATSFSFEREMLSDMIQNLSDKTLGLMTSSGHFLTDPEPFGIKNMNQKEAEMSIHKFLKASPQLSVIPSDVNISDLKVRHGGYDIRGALKDPGVAFPLEGLRKLESLGEIKLSKESFSFVGACAQGRLKNVLDDWIESIKKNHIELMLLVPV